MRPALANDLGVEEAYIASRMERLVTEARSSRAPFPLPGDSHDSSQYIRHHTAELPLTQHGHIAQEIVVLSHQGLGIYLLLQHNLLCPDLDILKTMI